MRRFAVLSLVMGMVVLVLAAPASAAPSLNASPSSGPPGTVIAVTGAEFTTGLECNLHLGALTFPPNNNSGLVGTCSVNGSGVLSGSFTVPDSSVGNYNLWACNGFASTPCSDEFVEKASTPFSIELQPTTTTVVVPPPTTPLITAPPDTTPLVTVPPLSIPPPAGCVIPEGAIVIDFDDLSPDSTASSEEVRSVLAEWSGLTLFQLDHETITSEGTRVLFGPEVLSGPSGQQPDISEFAARSRDTDPPTWLGSSSPPNILRSVDNAHFSVASNRTLYGEMDYFGFNLGFGHYSEGFERPEYVEYDVSISMLPIYEADGTVVEAAWDPVTVTLGPGPQAVTNCVLLENTAGVGYPDGSTWNVDIIPRYPDGSPIHLILEIDDVFYGTNAPAPVGCTIPESAQVIDFDDLGGGTHLWDTPNEYYTEGVGSFLYMFGTYEYATIEPDGAHINYNGPFRGTPGSVWAVPGGTSSPPYALWSDGVRAITLLGSASNYVGFNIGWPESDEPGVVALRAAGDSVTVDIRVRALPLVTTSGTFTADLGSASVALGPEFTPINQCVIIPLLNRELVPGFYNTVIEMTASHAGVPGDWSLVIDDLFFGVGEVLEATHPAAPPAAAGPAPGPAPDVTLPDVEQPIELPPIDPLPVPSDLPWRIAIGLGGLILGAGAMWGLRRD